jgi:hypothetical protein
MVESNRPDNGGGALIVFQRRIMIFGLVKSTSDVINHPISVSDRKGTCAIN